VLKSIVRNLDSLTAIMQKIPNEIEDNSNNEI
jgi:hypothetical protein